MKTIFLKTFVSFLLALIIFMIITFFILLYGFNSSIRKWEQERELTIKNNIEEFLKDIYRSNKNVTRELLENSIRYSIEGNTLLSIYDKDKKPILILRKRGMGMGRRTNQPQIKLPDNIQLTPVIIENEIVLYFSIHFVKFGDEYSNRKFLQSIRTTLIISFFLSFIIASIFAFLFSRNLSKEAKQVSEGINTIANGNLDTTLSEKGTKEIITIAKATNILSKKLKNEEQLRNQWTQDIAHDLRTPITALKTQLEGIKDGVLDLSIERIQKNLKEINRIEKLINDLGELTRLESPEMKLKLENINVSSFLSDILSTFQKNIVDKKIQTEINNSLKNIKGDEKLLNRAVSNILNNAIKYTKKNGLVKITCYKKDKTNLIEIFNSNSYIIEEEKTKIFDRLYRGEYSRNTNGTGLGLTISKKIIELHNGKISVKSNKDQGTSFIINI